MNLANLLSLSRIIFGILGIVSLLNGRPLFFLVFLIVGVLSDVLDGKVAKWQRTTSGSGKLVDLFSDQVFEISLASGLFFINELPFYYFIILSARVVISIVFIMKKKDEIRSSHGRREFRIHSLLSLIVFFFFAFTLSIKHEAPPLAEGLSTIALPYVLAPIAALMEVMTCMKFLPQLFPHKG